MVEGALVVESLAVLHRRLRPWFRRVEPFEQAGKYMAALVSELPRKNGWTIAEHAGDVCPDPTQRLLNHAVWDQDAVMATVRGFVVEALGGQDLVVAALDESGQEKDGGATAGVQRQYMGCAGRVANGVNTVYCSYATPGGHALVGARIYVPADQFADPDRRGAMGIAEQTVFRSKPQLAVDIMADMVADATMPAWCAGDEVYGRSGDLRTFCEDHAIGYVLRVGRAFHLDSAAGVRMRADAAADTLLSTADSWQVRAVAGSKGERRYAWAWVATSSPHHFLLLRKHLQTGELAYHYCHVPPGRTMTLVRVACLRWPVEEDFGVGKDHFGLDHSQVRLYTALVRHLVLTMAALAVCAVTAATPKPVPQNRSCRPAPTRTHPRTPA
jgi:SRSO17 transposase